MSYIHLLYHRLMSVLGSESVRRSFDADVVILKSQTPRRYCVHKGITLWRGHARITRMCTRAPAITGESHCGLKLADWVQAIAVTYLHRSRPVRPEFEGTDCGYRC